MWYSREPLGHGHGLNSSIDRGGAFPLHRYPGLLMSIIHIGYGSMMCKLCGAEEQCRYVPETKKEFPRMNRKPQKIGWGLAAENL